MRIEGKIVCSGIDLSLGLFSRQKTVWRLYDSAKGVPAIIAVECQIERSDDMHVQLRMHAAQRRGRRRLYGRLPLRCVLPIAVDKLD